ncbi:hypothetical protein, partial [Klebsiella variicola]|uniref:hypothetical protein n=1 Tax=Klebsiella variicola TaxID=244366 RepID=UPI00352B9C1E
MDAFPGMITLCASYKDFFRILAVDSGKLSGFQLENVINKVTEGQDDNWICPYISRHLLSLNPSLARCRRYSRG